MVICFFVVSNVEVYNRYDDIGMIYIWLVVWSMDFTFFPYIGKFVIPTDELTFFRRGRLNHQPVNAVYFFQNHQHLRDLNTVKKPSNSIK